MRQENDRKEKLLAEEMLGGKAAAGQKEPEKEKQSDADYAEKALTGELNNGDKESA